MIIRKMSLPRRTVLRGLGAAVALPLLDAMVPAASALSQTAAAPTRRFGVVYVPNGIAMEYWTPAEEGKRVRAHADSPAAGTLQGPVDGGLGPPGVLDPGPRRRGDDVSDRDRGRRRRDGAGGRHFDGPAPGPGVRPPHRAGIAPTGDRQPGQRRPVQRRSQLRLHQHHLLAEPDDSPADGEQPARGVRADVRRQREHRSGGAPRPDAARPLDSRLRDREGRRPQARGRAGRQPQGRRVSRGRAGHRTAHRAGRAAAGLRPARAGPARGHSRHVRRARRADVRPAGAGPPDRPDPRDLVHAGGAR